MCYFVQAFSRGHVFEGWHSLNERASKEPVKQLQHNEGKTPIIVHADFEKCHRSNNEVIKLLFSTRVFLFCLADDAFSSMCKNSAALPQHPKASFTGPPALASCSRGSCLSISSKALLHERYDFGLHVLGVSDTSQPLEHNLATIHCLGLSATRVLPELHPKQKEKLSLFQFVIQYSPFRLLSLMSWMKVNWGMPMAQQTK